MNKERKEGARWRGRGWSKEKGSLNKGKWGLKEGFSIFLLTESGETKQKCTALVANKIYIALHIIVLLSPVMYSKISQLG